MFVYVTICLLVFVINSVQLVQYSCNSRVITKIAISSTVIGLKYSYIQLIDLPCCIDRTVCYWTVCYRTVQ